MGHPVSAASPAIGRKEIPIGRPSNDEEQMTKKKEKLGDRREYLFARRDDVQNILVQTARVLAIHAQLGSTSVNAREGFVNRDLKTAINVRRCLVLTAKPEELKRSCFVGQPFRLNAFSEELKPVAVSGPKKAGRRLCVRRCMYACWSKTVLRFAHDICARLDSALRFSQAS